MSFVMPKTRTEPIISRCRKLLLPRFIKTAFAASIISTVPAADGLLPPGGSLDNQKNKNNYSS